MVLNGLASRNLIRVEWKEVTANAARLRFHRLKRKMEEGLAVEGPEKLQGKGRKQLGAKATKAAGMVSKDEKMKEEGEEEAI